MIIKVIATLFIVSYASAQAPPPPPATAPPPAAAPGPVAAPETAPVAPPATAPAPAAPANPGGNSAPPPAAAPAPGGPVAPPPANPENPAPVLLAPVTNQVLPSLAGPADKKGAKGADKKLTLKEIERNAALRNKSPFMIPTDLYLKIKKRQGEKVVDTVIDDNISPKIRWPLRSYSLIGVLSGVKVPKALIKDKDGTIHTYRLKELIANSGGYISEIGNGEVIIVERGAEFKLSLKKDSRQ